MKTTSFTGALAVAALITLPQLAAAGSFDSNRVVRSESGHVLRSEQFGTCVRTKWDAGTDVCAPPKAAKAQLRTVLAKEDSTVYFEFDSARLTPRAQTQLENVAATLSKAEDVKRADIVGYADRIGASSYNQKLSRERAESVKKYLADRGYLNTQVAAVRGVGEAQPTASCDGSVPRDEQIACLSPDRRVEIEIQYLDTKRVK